jgi:hypothetical protein
MGALIALSCQRPALLCLFGGFPLLPAMWERGGEQGPREKRVRLGERGLYLVDRH